MIVQKVRLEIVNNFPPNTCVISPNIFAALNSDKERVHIKAGSRITTCNVIKPNDTIQNTVFLSQDLGDSLGLFSGLILNAKIIPQSATIQFGPFIGVYGAKNLQNRRIFSEQTSFFHKLCNASRRQGGLTYVLGPNDLDFKNNMAVGHVLVHENGVCSWQARSLPLPDVFYDRGLFPKGPNKKLSMQVRRYLRKAWGNRFFNPLFFNKWRTHKWLIQHPRLADYLPETFNSEEIAPIAQMFNKYPSVYLKPAGGSSGRGIIRVESRSGLYHGEYLVKKKTHTFVYENPVTMWHDLMRKGIINKTYIVQPDLNLAKYEGRPFDIRAMMQKGSDGNWSLTGAAARIAGSANTITTNLHAGGKAQLLPATLASIFGTTKGSELHQEIVDLCYTTCNWIEEVTAVSFGEIAVDLGVSENGKLWLIELNAVPGRTIFRKSGAVNLGKKALQQPIDYAFYLAGFGAVKK